jgi:hypothetical protein
MTESTSDAERCIAGETGLSDAHLAAALRGHSGGVATTVETVAAAFDSEREVGSDDVDAALTEVEELAALLRDLSA